MRKTVFLQTKPYVMSAMIAFTVLVLVNTALNAIQGHKSMDNMTILAMFVCVALACFFMSLTDRLPVKSVAIVALMDILDITVSVVLCNTTFFPIFDYTPLDILITSGMIVGVYLIVCFIFYLNAKKSECMINEKINIMKKGGNVHE